MMSNDSNRSSKKKINSARYDNNVSIANQKSQINTT